MLMAALFLVTKRYKQLSIDTGDSGINQVWYIHTMEYFQPWDFPGGPVAKTSYSQFDPWSGN